MSASLAPECNEVKEKYDTCFLKWYSEKYLRGNPSTDECEPLFKQYKACLSVRVAMAFRAGYEANVQQKALKEKGVDTMLAEARENTVAETDAEHMRR